MIVNEIDVRDPNVLKENQYSRELFPALEGKQYELLRDDIKENGIQVPVEITKDNGIIRGNERLKIALELGLHRIPVKICASDDLTDQKIGLIKDNLARKSLDFNTRFKCFEELKNLYGMKHGETLRRGPYDLEEPLEPSEKMTEEEIASEVGMAETTFHRAQTVQKSDLPIDIKEGVLKGTLPVRPIADLLNQPKNIRQEIVEKIERRLKKDPEIELHVAPIVRAVESKFRAASLGQIKPKPSKVEPPIVETPPPEPQKEKPDRTAKIKQVLDLLKTHNLSCPIDGETEITWKCGHEFK